MRFIKNNTRGGLIPTPSSFSYVDSYFDLRRAIEEANYPVSFRGQGRRCGFDFHQTLRQWIGVVYTENILMRM